jgi:hypothetical protein
MARRPNRAMGDVAAAATRATRPRETHGAFRAAASRRAGLRHRPAAVPSLYPRGFRGRGAHDGTPLADVIGKPGAFASATTIRCPR